MCLEELRLIIREYNLLTNTDDLVLLENNLETVKQHCRKLMSEASQSSLKIDYKKNSMQ